MQKRGDVSLVYYLDCALDKMTGDEARAYKAMHALDDVNPRDPKDVERFLRVSSADRMAQQSVITEQLVNIRIAIGRMKNIIFGIKSGW